MNTGATFEVHSITDLDTVDKFYSFYVNSFDKDSTYLDMFNISCDFDYLHLFQTLYTKEYMTSYIYKKIESAIDSIYDEKPRLALKSNFLSDEEYFALVIGVPLKLARDNYRPFWNDSDFFDKTFGFLYHIIESVFNMTDIETKAEIMEEFYDDACEAMDEEYKYNGGYKIPYLEKPDLNIFSTYMSNNAIAEIENALNECLEIVDDGDILKDLLTTALNKVTTP